METNITKEQPLRCPVCGIDGAYERRKDGWATCSNCGIEANGKAADVLEEIDTYHFEAQPDEAERSCHIIKTWSDSDYVDGWRYRCSECSCFIPVNELDQETGDVISAANYCPNCGAKVVD